jgi:tRNA pseudouridine55 synthase
VDGLVVVDKPAGWTSHDVVGKMRRIYGQRRIGHAGTLDPDATGVLLLGLGRVTRLLRYLTDTSKCYRGTIVFGVATDTLDASGVEVARQAMRLTDTEIASAAQQLVGDIEQVPPMVSAVKVGGKKLYELARAGTVIERAARAVHIDAFDIEGVDQSDPDHPCATVTVRCSSGTYVRSLAADLGAGLGGCAHLASLRRTAVGAFTLDDARPVDAIELDPAGAVLAPADALRGMARVDVDDDRARAISHGAVLPARDLGGDPGPVAVVGPDGALLAVYERGRVSARPAVVLCPATETNGRVD